MTPIDHTRKVVELEGVSFSYGDEPVISNVEFAIHDREFVTVVGPNGSGKSTLVKLILGLLKPTGGAIRVFGKRPDQASSHIGYVPQHARLDPHFPATVLDVVLMGRLGNGGSIGPYGADDKAAARKALERVALLDCATKPFSDLSGGQRQRILIARALAGDPELLILDEPTANLDAASEKSFYELLGELKREKTIMLVSHDTGFVSRLVDSVVCVRCDAGIHPVSDVTGEHMNELYGSDVRMVRHDHLCTRDDGSCSS